jgi:phage tail sheath protein FI
MDYIRPLSQGVTDFHTDQGGSGTLSSAIEFSWVTSLDDITAITGSGGDVQSAYWASGSRAAGTSYTALGAGGANGGTWEDLLDSGVNRLTSAMFGGFDGLDIYEMEPFRNSGLIGGSETTNYAYNTIQRAIDTLADPELLQTNIMSVPGLTDEGLTTRLIETCESRGDALAVVDLKGTYQPAHEDASLGAASRASNIDTTISNLVNRRINSSYGCAYYPWVDARDQISGISVRLPPSVIALGVFASTEKKRDLWFAPAGFNRGGLTEGAGGVPVTGVEQRLTSGDRDKLYERNINPIASFPSEGIVVFGQKTLQVTPSALDRINVRRMLIFVKREVQSIANKILFDPNIQVTWMRFKTQTDRLLRNVQSRFGVDDFRVILDSSTTTPDLVDRNIIYAKVLIKPTRAAEFIAIDFVITRSGTDLDAL